MKKELYVFDTDVLVVGGGGAGARAGLEAAKQGAAVILCVKGEFGTSGATSYQIVELAGFNAADGSPSNTQEDYLQDIVEAALGTCDERLAEVLSREAIEERIFLENIGVPFEKIDGKYLTNKGCFATKHRFHIIPGHGHPIVACLKREIEKQQRVQVLENTMITSILTVDGITCGAFGLQEDGSLVLIRAKAVVLAAGGAGRMFAFNMNPPDVTGDGYSLAYNAGATLTNMEFMQFGLGTIYPNYNLIGSWLFPLKPVLKNGRGEEIIGKYLPEGISLEMVIDDKTKHFPFSSRDNSKYIEIAVHKEILLGNNTEHGGIALDFRGVSAEMVNTLPVEAQRMWQMAKSWLKSRGIDLDNQPAEIATFAHAVNGGPLIDENGATDVEGLFAVGENAAGPHGADRLGGNMLVNCQVFGRRAGRAAALFAKDRSVIPLSPRDQVVKAEMERISSIQNKGCGHASLDLLLTELQKTMWRNMVVVRSKRSMQSCLADLNELEDKLAPAAINSIKDVRTALEIKNMLSIGAIMTRTAMAREESRGSHYREDFPKINDTYFKKNAFIKLVNGKQVMAFETIDRFRGEGFHAL